MTQVQVRHPSPDHRPGGARLHQAACPQGAGARSHSIARRSGHRRAARNGRARRASRPTSSRATSAAQSLGRAGRHDGFGRATAALWPHRRRHADRGAARPQPARSMCPEACSAAASTTPSRSRAIRWSMPASSTATPRSSSAATRPRRLDRRRAGRQCTRSRSSGCAARATSIALEPANPAFETRIFGPDRVQIQGRMVGLLRRF